MEQIREDCIASHCRGTGFGKSLIYAVFQLFMTQRGRRYKCKLSNAPCGLLLVCACMDLQKYVGMSLTASFGALRLGAAVAALLFKAVVCQDETEDNRETNRTTLMTLSFMIYI